ncbi:PRC-barrel domain-containing protein [Desulfonatronum lacustre]|uniref:PRC-barrel domain-containing protein n=1 Tax=Desulfonatronum lacustre TaxID=66849 RepID=UPI0006848EE9|nr:PRC-barrel domain-containing protein [Desulfonatronum lacustre]SMP73639.1 PRC-barrel domain-containing protein [Desulfonatronum zhilinae]
MKTLIVSIIIGLLSLSPAFAQSTMDTKQKETDQKRSEQTGEYQTVPKSDQDQLKKTDQDRRSGQEGMSRDMDKKQRDMDKKQNETDQTRRPGQAGEQSEVLPKYDQDRQVTTDPARPHRATDVEPQEGYQRVSSDLITADDLQSASVYGANNENIADVNEVLMTPEGKVERIVVNVGGFLGMGARSIAIDVNEADIHKDADNDVRVYIPMSEEELRKMPEYKK